MAAGEQAVLRTTDGQANELSLAPHRPPASRADCHCADRDPNSRHAPGSADPVGRASVEPVRSDGHRSLVAPHMKNRDWHDIKPKLLDNRNQPRKRMPRDARGRVAGSRSASLMVGIVFIGAYHTTARTRRLAGTTIGLDCLEDLAQPPNSFALRFLHGTPRSNGDAMPLRSRSLPGLADR